MQTRLNRFDSKNELLSMGSWLLLLRVFCVVTETATAAVAAASQKNQHNWFLPLTSWCRQSLTQYCNVSIRCQTAPNIFTSIFFTMLVCRCFYSQFWWTSICKRFYCLSLWCQSNNSITQLHTNTPRATIQFYFCAFGFYLLTSPHRRRKKNSQKTTQWLMLRIKIKWLNWNESKWKKKKKIGHVPV